jgi:hypothetical protein
MTPAEWGLFLGYAAALTGIAIISPKIATAVGVGTILVLVLKNADRFNINLLAPVTSKTAGG